MTPVAAAVGLVADQLLGEPPLRWHPVARFGALMSRLEEAWWADRRGRGALHALTGVGIAIVAGRALERALGRRAAATVATAVTVAGRMLDHEALALGDELDRGDLAAARRRLPSLVGRDPSRLDGDGVARAVVESVAENSVDGVIAPALFGAVFGAPGAFAYRAVNTLDAMVGHRTARYRAFGWASARLDDAANWVPARVTAVAVAAVRPRRAGAVLRAVRHDAGGHPSPNAGVVEAAFAAALGVELGGRTDYGERVEERPRLGRYGRTVCSQDIAAAVRLRRHVTAAVGAGLVAARLAAALRARGSRAPRAVSESTRLHDEA